MIEANKKVWICLIVNFILMLFVLIIVFVFKNNDSKYFRFGPQSDLILISVKIDTWTKWLIVVFLTCLIKGCDLLVNEIGSPIIGFRVYNPDCKEIKDFSMNELNFLTNSMWFFNNVRHMLMIVISVTQVDIAFLSILFSELVCIFTVRYLISEKKFIKNEEEILEL